MHRYFERHNILFQLCMKYEANIVLFKLTIKYSTMLFFTGSMYEITDVKISGCDNEEEVCEVKLGDVKNLEIYLSSGKKTFFFLQILCLYFVTTNLSDYDKNITFIIISIYDLLFLKYRFKSDDLKLT